MVQHVLRFENFTAEFLELLEDYDMHFVINVTATQKRKRRSNATLTENDFGIKTLKLIRRVYGKDFALGGYNPYVVPSVITEENENETIAIESPPSKED